MGRLLLAFGIAAAILCSCPAGASAQYFGRNKVHYDQADVRVLATEHFDNLAALDGGQIMNLWVKPQRLVYQICIGTAAALVVYGLVTGQYYICMLFGYFAYTNYQSMTTNRWR